jgi:hypothetical protein
MEKREIHVVIDSTEKQQQAIEILQRHGEIIHEKEIAMRFDKRYKYLVFCSGSWYVASYPFGATEISIKELDELLTNQI